MLQVNVTLPSGNEKSLQVPLSSNVGDLRSLSQKSFGQSCLKLVTAEGHILSNPTESLEAAGVQEGDRLTGIVQEVQIAATERAFALWCCGGDRIVTWGLPDWGGDSSAMAWHKIRSVQQVQATSSAFAALLADGSVVTWGDAEYAAG